MFVWKIDRRKNDAAQKSAAFLGGNSRQKSSDFVKGYQNFKQKALRNNYMYALHVRPTTVFSTLKQSK